MLFNNTLGKTLACLLLVLTAACGTQTTEPTGTTAPVPSDPTPLMVDPLLGVEPTAAVTGTWALAVWKRTDQDASVALRIDYLLGEEDSEDIRLLIQDLDGAPALMSATLKHTGWDGQNTTNTTESIDPANIRIQEWNPGGVVSGVIELERRDIPFWSDASGPVSFEAQSPLSLHLGGLAWLDSYNIIQFSNVVTDSRCPADVECIWEGELVVELTLHSERSVVVEVKTGGDAVRVGDYAVRLTQAPVANLDRPWVPGDLEHQITLMVEPA